ncbi:hypothetical protein FHL15_011314 [Xylaria flabelliformis]|uniref:Uncharacterized protein n=1 Tax=Xylaria flabelliformis TaxID=2512241 RepID=A0A553HIL1_9PEZI|nr:hypothetical protein FHL15_011314 [Xylaria flabelliformis]
MNGCHMAPIFRPGFRNNSSSTYAFDQATRPCRLQHGGNGLHESLQRLQCFNLDDEDIREADGAGPRYDEPCSSLSRRQCHREPERSPKLSSRMMPASTAVAAQLSLGFLYDGLIVFAPEFVPGIWNAPER